MTWGRRTVVLVAPHLATVTIRPMISSARVKDPPKPSAWDVAAAEPALTREIRGALRFHGDDQINPYRFADALWAGARAVGATVLPHTEGCRVLVNAAGAWAGQIAAMAGTGVPVTPVRGQIVCTETLPKVITAGVSTTDCYLAQKHYGEVIIGSTTDRVGYDTTVTATATRTLAEGAVRAVPTVAGATVKRVWAGLRPGSPDELPILGPVDGLDGYLNACGHFRTGILNAPLTGLVISELAAGVAPTHPIEPFLLSRFTAGQPVVPETRESLTVQ